MITPESWPTDPGECHDLLNRLKEQVEDLQAALDQAAKLHDQTVQGLEQAVEELRRELELYRRYVFGPRRERLVEAPGQGHLFELDGSESVTAPPEPPDEQLHAPARNLAEDHRADDDAENCQRLVNQEVEHRVQHRLQTSRWSLAVDTYSSSRASSLPASADRSGATVVQYGSALDAGSARAAGEAGDLAYAAIDASDSGTTRAEVSMP